MAHPEQLTAAERNLHVMNRVSCSQFKHLGGLGLEHYLDWQDNGAYSVLVESDNAPPQPRASDGPEADNAIDPSALPDSDSDERVIPEVGESVADAKLKPVEERIPKDVPKPKKAAILSQVVKISRDGFYMNSDAYYTGSTKYTKNLASVRPNCLGISAEQQPFRTDFVIGLENLRALEKKKITPGNEVTSIIRPMKVGGEGIRIVHPVLFYPRAPGDAGPGTETETAEGSADTAPAAPAAPDVTEGEAGNASTAVASESISDNVFTLRNWPLNSPQSEAERSSLVDTHDVDPISAYGATGKLIQPQYYESSLRGAEVEVYFHLRHYLIKSLVYDKGKVVGEKFRDTFTSQLVSMRVIRPPMNAVPPTPRRKRIHHHDPVDNVLFTPKKRKTGRD